MSEVTVYVEIPVKVLVTRYTPGRPAVMYLRNGDPGYPADPEELEYELSTCPEELVKLVETQLQTDSDDSVLDQYLSEQDEPGEDDE
jgi:hypothetical protein